MKSGEAWAVVGMEGLGCIDQRPVIVAIAGPNGAGKSTFFESHLKSSGLRFLNADILARDLKMGAMEAAEMASHFREVLMEQGESFIFETVYSDPVGDKLGFLKRAAQRGYSVVLCFIGIQDSNISEQRVAMRVTQGGHDVPSEKLVERYPRTLANLAASLRDLPFVLVFDNNDIRTPFRSVAVYRNGLCEWVCDPLPIWFQPMWKD